ncbi:PAS domain S-box protein [Massilia orientalis]|uniref:PAS domain S-box protein n=1 Tax=Massilia orientalis TaxID=3050128 RepID=A0ACC7M9F3_9BURK|nr:PAS domain S-box protein [Massilia sp. YIM B02787]
MPAASLPPDESERQELLEFLDILDTAPEPVFDQVTRLATRLLGVPIAVFSLVDKDRQWFKSRVGLDVQQTSREVAFCAHAILQSAPLVVPDATADPRFEGNALVHGDPNIRFYAGIPIRSAGGHALGTLCAMDSRPRQLSADDLQALRDLADIVTKEIQHREALAVARESVERSGVAIAHSEARFRSVFDLASIGMAMVAPDGGWLSVNEALCRIVGYAPEELYRTTFRDITYPQDLDTDLALLRQLEAGTIDQYQLEKRYVRKDGSPVWINLNVTKKAGPDGAPLYYVAAVKDIQAQKETEAKLQALHADLETRVATRTRELNDAVAMLESAMAHQRQAEQLLKDREAELRSVIENANDAYIGLDRDGIVREWNRQAETTFGWNAGEAIGRPLDALVIPAEMGAMHRRGMARYLTTGAGSALNQRLELPAVCKDGSRLTVEVRITALEVNGTTIFSAFLHDITARKAREAQREYDSRHDALTGLLNRRALTENLPIAQARSRRTGRMLGVLFIDLDGFKAVNDTHGHEAGDKLLCEIAARLQDTVRKTDSVFRLAGDEFTVLLEDMTDTYPDAHAVAHKLVERISAPIDLCGQGATVGASIGIAIFAPESNMSGADLVKEADYWMYEAKKAGRGRVLPEKNMQQSA